ncbi:hypothetical protein CGSMWGv6119V5_00622 [Gardnerella vaginalis 6119V5]|uniref:FHA domain-containing protein n=1 Tax=Gardnerella vaginalis TaxID=2702 RepID=UPI00026353E3|nr:FHA domain-containing protein [Gardnerella vaginalis]EIK88002.1 hypothetical protein CGSMWGv6119V5_00622 [Gardnerella vaginalis 6119V5]
MSERQVVQRWMITVGGVEQARVGAGQSVEIGRKPIRPLREDGFKRIDIVDNKRSMSKRHALLIVDPKGVATIRDLHSTNGTYLVGSNGDLLRLDPDVDFQLPDSLMRMQFGDVPVDFVRVEDEVQEEETSNVRDLFSYATDDEKHEEPAASGLSVDQILDLRAGEPTGIFHAQSVSEPGLSWQKGKSIKDALEGSASVDNASVDNASVDDASVDSDPINAAPINHDVTVPVVLEQQEAPVEPRNLFADARAESENAQAESENAQVAQSQAEPLNAEPLNAEPLQAEPLNVEPLQAEQSQVESAQAESYEVESAEVESSEIESTEIESTEIESTETEPAEVEPSKTASNPLECNRYYLTHEDSNKAYENYTNIGPLDSRFTATSIDISDISGIDSDASYTPAFEPGSVFEKVSKGEFDAQQNIVEAGGFTSKEAEESTDFSKQFEMAQHSELLPYLASNPGLYDDLYAWLAAQGNADVDAALARNSGYSAYRKAIEQ